MYAKLCSQLNDKYGTYENLGAHTLIYATFSKSKIGLKKSKKLLQHELPATQTNLYTKFGKHQSTTLAYISILVQAENEEQILNYFLQFLLLGV